MVSKKKLKTQDTNNKDPESEAPGAAAILSQWPGLHLPIDVIIQ